MALFGRRRRGSDLPDSWPALADRMVVGRGGLDADELHAHDALTGYLLDQIRWEAARGFEVTDEMRLTICGNAALLGLGLGIDVYRLVRTVIVHDGTIVSRESRPGRVAGTVDTEPHYNAGEAHDGLGPILLSWRDTRYETRHPHTGRNVVIHEFAHKFDMADGASDGTPPMSDPRLRERWADVATRTFRAIRAADDNDPAIRDYAGTNPTEFFAVVAETFFTRPAALREHHPVLYGLASAVFEQDPAAREERSRPVL